MPTYSFSLNREQMVDKVLGKLGVKDPIETASAKDLFVVTDAIDLRLKEMQALGILWFNVAGGQTSVTITGGVSTATITATDYLFPVSLMLDVGNDQYPIELIGHTQYQAIMDKASTGEPEKAFISGTTIRLYPTPSMGYTANLTYQAIAADSATGTALDLGTGMQRAFIDVIAGDLIDEYQVQEPFATRLLAKQAQGLKIITILNTQRVDTETTQTTWY